MSRFDLRFKDLSLSVENPISKKNKIILNGVSGEFRSGELTGIIGPSGSGKSSLLNILSGYHTKNVDGFIQLNGIENSRYIQQYSAYIMQESKFHQFITVYETLMFTLNCKAMEVDKCGKLEKIKEILLKMGLEKRQHVYTGELSGGEQKRLSIAIGLLYNPKIIFLDEPTTNLDSVTSTQCVQLLKKLAKEDRTIICSIHQPSAIVFQMFDHIYALASGCCIYQGTSASVVPFLSDLDLVCPSIYSPADFLLEIANNDYGNQNDRLREKVIVREPREIKTFDNQAEQLSAKKIIKMLKAQSIRNEIFSLVMRNWLNNTRDKTMTLMRLMIHIGVSVCIGVLYQGIGQEGSHILNIYKFLFFNIFILMFTAFSSLQTTFPIEFPIVKRENFNGTYTVFSYFTALTLSDAPILIVCNFIYVSICYLMTDQPFEMFRFLAYFSVILLLSFTSQGLGLIAGCMLDVKFTLILGSFFTCPFVLFSNFFIHMKDTERLFHPLFNLSFIKYAFDGSMLSIFGFDRDKMECEAPYCHFRRPEKFLSFLQINDDFYSILIKLAAFAIVFRLLAFIVLYVRLKR